MKEIWWVRHATTDWNAEKRWQGHSDVPLNEKGREQARTLTPYLKDIPFDAVWSSDLIRSAETARLALPEAEIHTDKRLREIHMGIAEGKTWDELTLPEQQSITDWWTDPYSKPFPGTQESLTQVTARVKAWRDELPDGTRTIVFTHGGIVRTCFWEMVGQPRHREWTMELANTGIVRIRYTEDIMTLVSFNDLAHVKDAWKLPPCQNVPGN